MSTPDRCEILRLIAQACGRGCRKSVACGLSGLSVRTVHRWLKNGHVDQRKGRRAKPVNALSQAERQHVLYLIPDLFGRKIVGWQIHNNRMCAICR